MISRGLKKGSISVSLHVSEYDHGLALDEFVDWCDQSFLHINVSKTSEMFIDFRRRPCLPAPCLCDQGKVGGSSAAVQIFGHCLR